MVVSGCSGTPPVTEVEVRTAPVERPRLNLPPPDELNLREVRWIVVTPDNIESVFETLKNAGQPQSLFALTGTGYENLSLNINDIRSLLQQNQRLLVSYRNYYEP